MKLCCDPSGLNVHERLPLAEREGVSERYIGRILHLAWLAPDIVRVIQSGEAPETLTLARLKKGYPLAWAQQRAVLLGR